MSMTRAKRVDGRAKTSPRLRVEKDYLSWSARESRTERGPEEDQTAPLRGGELFVLVHNKNKKTYKKGNSECANMW